MHPDITAPTEAPAASAFFKRGDVVIVKGKNWCTAKAIMNKNVWLVQEYDNVSYFYAYLHEVILSVIQKDLMLFSRFKLIKEQRHQCHFSAQQV